MSSEGAVVVTFFSKTPIATPGRVPDGVYDPRRLVEKLTIADNI